MSRCGLRRRRLLTDGPPHHRLQLLPGGFCGQPYRATDGTIYCVVEGSGRSTIDGRTFEWEPSDVFVVPSWSAVRHAAAADAVLFSFSDRPAQKALGLWREECPCVA